MVLAVPQAILYSRVYQSIVRTSSNTPIAYTISELIFLLASSLWTPQLYRVSGQSSRCHFMGLLRALLSTTNACTCDPCWGSLSRYSSLEVTYWGLCTLNLGQRTSRHVASVFLQCINSSLPWLRARQVAIFTILNPTHQGRNIPSPCFSNCWPLGIFPLHMTSGKVAMPALSDTMQGMQDSAG